MDAYKYVLEKEKELVEEFKKVDDIAFQNSKKVLDAFHNVKIQESHFNATTGYGYQDDGRDAIEEVYSQIFKAESALVRTQIISGTHALTVCLFGLLRPNDILLSITGKPYDTLDEVIGIKENDSSLAAFNVKYRQVDLINDEFDYDKIKEELLKNKIKVVTIQRSKGYSTRKSITIDKLEKVIKFIKEIDKEVVIMIDNCYCEFVSTKEPIEIGADVAVGSLIKNLGGGIAPNGGYIVGRSDLVSLVAQRLTVPGEGKEVGPTLGLNKQLLQGLYLAPTVVASSIKTAILTSKVLNDLGYKVEPNYNDERADIVQNIIFGNEKDLIKYCQIIQSSSAIDSFCVPEPVETPGYQDKVIMASGSFTQGSSIELSCDGPIREPYIAYQQGSLTYEYGKLAIINVCSYLLNK